ncbi:hypothetical protein [Streptomyces sp. NRRL S-920]|uniref:hypothetical protein n=1 Tax=Streptomyces sp. NRRL S-920 TaxID=1463921 RepID=UPI0009976C59|nr:hypothetical protein [Streptomyces sp. NRRL S-920]
MEYHAFRTVSTATPGLPLLSFTSPISSMPGVSARILKSAARSRGLAGESSSMIRICSERRSASFGKSAARAFSSVGSLSSCGHVSHSSPTGHFLTLPSAPLRA